MPNWKHRICIKDIHDMFDGDETKINEVGKAMAKRLLKSIPMFSDQEDKNFLEETADEFDGVETVYHYDCILACLYDWGDADHNCWIDSFKY